MPTGGQIVVSCLKAQGIEVVFGMPGSHILPIYDALYSEPGIRRILARDERGAAFMADGYARASGDIGVCLTTAGPGATNAATGIANAFSESIPVLLIAGQVGLDTLGKGGYHEMDALGLFRPITKWNGRASATAEIPAVMARAFRELRSGRPRPVHVELPLDVLSGEAPENIPGPAEGDRPPIDQTALSKAAEALRAARRPIVLAGGGAASAGVSAQIAQVAERLGAAVATTRMGKGTIPETHPLALGDSRGEEATTLVGEADAMLAVGCRFTEVSTGRWGLRVPRCLIQIDMDEGEIGRNYPVEVGIVGNAKEALEGLLEGLSGKGRSPDAAWAAKIKAAKARGEEALRTEPRRLVDPRDLRDVLPEGAIVAADCCMPGYALFPQFTALAPRQVLFSAGFIAMGYGLPAAIGAKVARPERPVVALCGDGGFLMTFGELATMAKYRIPVIVLIANDRRLTAIRRMQDRLYRGRQVDVDLVNPDFLHLAESFGLRAWRATTREEVRAALSEAIEAEAPAVIEAVEG